MTKETVHAQSSGVDPGEIPEPEGSRIAEDTESSQLGEEGVIEAETKSRSEDERTEETEREPAENFRLPRGIFGH